jgi:Ca2+:H+ antiporter
MKYVWITIIIALLLGLTVIFLYIYGASEVLIFIIASIDIIFLALLLGWSTEVLSIRSGPTLGGFINASLGNGTELIIGILGIKKGLFSLVKASITGAIVTNLLVIVGISTLVGGIKYKTQKFSTNLSANNTKLMAIALSAMMLPSLFSFATRHSDVRIDIYEMSILISGLLILLYIFNLLFVFKTHKYLFKTEDDEKEEECLLMNWKTSSAILLLALSSIIIFFIADILIETIRPTIESLGWSEIFLGVVVIGIIGNAAENSSAIMFGYKNKMNLSFSIVASSSQQIALFVAPVLVIFGYIFGYEMDLNFTTMEILAIAITTLIFYLTSIDGKTNWLEGLKLLVIFGMLSIAFYFV